MNNFDDSFDVVVIGGGPGGSIAGTLLAREGFKVAIFEKDEFPRYHIGESLLTSVIPVLQFAGLHDRIDKYGFVRKYRAFFRILQGNRAARLEFGSQRREAENNPYTYQVIRSEFDKLLLDYAQECGVSVHEKTPVNEVLFEGDRPIGVRVSNTLRGTREIGCRYLVDASGLAGLMASRYLKNRRYQEYFANVAIGQYWENFNQYVDDDGNPQIGAFSMEAIPDSSGWCWAIPLHNGTLSLGAVIHRDKFAEMKKCLGTTEKVYSDILARCPDMQRLIKGARTKGETHVWQDYSYAADRFSGPHFRLVGDAAAFIDPFFSSGVHLAVYGALSAAATISASLRNEVDEAVSSNFHNRCVRESYVRFVVIVAGVYRQIRNQGEVVLTGVTDGDIQPAFRAISPVVTGNFDFAGDLEGTSRQALEHVLSYVKELIHDMQDPHHSSPIGNLLGRTMLGDKDSLVMQGLTPIDGMRIRMERGRLGLEKVPPK